MNPDLHEHGLTDFWKEPWTASTWGTWSSQSAASQGLEPSSSWMYTSYGPKSADNAEDSDADLDFGGSFSSSTGSIGSLESSMASSIRNCVGGTTAMPMLIAKPSMTPSTYSSSSLSSLLSVATTAGAHTSPPPAPSHQYHQHHCHQQQNHYQHHQQQQQEQPMISQRPNNSFNYKYKSSTNGNSTNSSSIAHGLERSDSSSLYLTTNQHTGHCQHQHQQQQQPNHAPHHRQLQPQHTSPMVAPMAAPMAPPGLSPQCCARGLSSSGRPPLSASAAAVATVASSAPIAISRAPGASRPRRSSSVTSMDSEMSALSAAGSVGSACSLSSVISSTGSSASAAAAAAAAVAASVAVSTAFQIGGYRTVELLPTAVQRQTLQKWFGVVRWTHNRAVDALRADPGLTATSLRAAVAEAEADHDWAAAVPLAIRDATVAQLVGALHQAQRSAEVAAAATGESAAIEPIGTAAVNSALKYRTRKDRLEHVVLRADGFQFGIPYPESFGYAPLASSAPIPDRLGNDAILVRSTERFYLCVPESSMSSSLDRSDSIGSIASCF